MISANPTWGCSCSLTIAWLADHGGAHAKRVRDQKIPESAWTLADWFAHFLEEERLLFPYFARHIQRMLGGHHQIFRLQLRTAGRVDETLMQRHAAIENAAVKELMRAA